MPSPAGGAEMTAEIAVLNKSAVALAADSAVTIGRGAAAKIYNSVNKVFELHEVEPVGIMIYGRLTFMGLPIETVIKTYRKEHAQKTCETIREYKDSFIRWLGANVRYDIEDEKEAIALVCGDIVERVNLKVDRRVRDEILKTGKYLRSKDNPIAAAVLKEEIASAKLVDRVSYYSRKYVQNIETSFGKEIDDFASMLDIDTNATTKRLFHAAVIEIIVRKKLSSFRTGVVIAGFGTSEICPSLERFEMDGIIGGSLKVVENKSIDVGRRGPHADVTGFAQIDMIDRFLHGVDSEMYDYAKGIVANSIRSTATEIVAALTGTPSDKVVLSPDVMAVLNKIQNDQVKNLDKFKDRNYTKPILDMIRHMPKPELATLAKALIDLTSLKRKVSREQESVGGEVDVAVISKSEGFVWVQRKHYFPADINPRFRARHFKAS
jgi:hypothetical protein